MEFEFDPKKSASNKDKHGLDFAEAQALWKDGRAVEAAAREKNEPRRLAVGQIDGVMWTAIFTIRNGKVRLISVRRSRGREIGYYQEQIEDDNGS